MAEDKYAWQKDTYRLWKENNYHGLLKGCVSAGKSRAGCNCIEGYLNDFGKDREIWIVAPTNEILNQWKAEPQIKDLKNIKYMTYISAVNRLMERYKEDVYSVPDLLILDEAHTASAPVAGKVLNYGVPHILGLSGTPGGIEKAIGGVFQEVDWECANIAPTTIHYTFFPISEAESEKYKQKCASIKKYREDHPYSTMWNDDILSMLYLKRREYVYNMKSRLPLAVKLIKQNLGRRMMVFFERKKQVRELSTFLTHDGIDHCIHIAGDEHLDEYLDGMSDIVLCCKKLNSGFSDPSTEVGIIVSTALGQANHIQRVGRIIRPKEGKHADVYVLLAEGTNDEELYSQRKQMFPDEMVDKIEWND